MRITALWSGGLDSTAMLMYLSSQGHEVSAAYVDFMNNGYKTKRERAAIEGLIADGFLDEYKIRWLGTVYKVQMEDPLGNFTLCQPPVWINALSSIAKGTTQALAIGYVLGDDVVSFLDDIRKLYKATHPFLDHTPKLLFPMTKFPKQKLWREMPRAVQKRVTWCEGAQENDFCGICAPCRKAKFLGIHHPNDELVLDHNLEVRKSE